MHKDRGHRHTWTSKPDYPEDGVFCMECGRRKGQKPFRKLDEGKVKRGAI